MSWPWELGAGSGVQVHRGHPLPIASVSAANPRCLPPPQCKEVLRAGGSRTLGGGGQTCCPFHTSDPRYEEFTVGKHTCPSHMGFLSLRPWPRPHPSSSVWKPVPRATTGHIPLCSISGRLLCLPALSLLYPGHSLLVAWPFLL